MKNHSNEIRNNEIRIKQELPVYFKILRFVNFLSTSELKKYKQWVITTSRIIRIEQITQILSNRFLLEVEEALL